MAIDLVKVKVLYFLKRRVFSPFLKNVIVFENLRFPPSTRTHENGVFENLHSGERFQKAPFLVAENGVYVWTQEQNGEKISAYVWTGPKKHCTEVNKVRLHPTMSDVFLIRGPPDLRPDLSNCQNITLMRLVMNYNFESNLPRVIETICD